MTVLDHVVFTTTDSSLEVLVRYQQFFYWTPSVTKSTLQGYLASRNRAKTIFQSSQVSLQWQTKHLTIASELIEKQQQIRLSKGSVQLTDKTDVSATAGIVHLKLLEWFELIVMVYRSHVDSQWRQFLLFRSSYSKPKRKVATQCSGRLVCNAWYLQRSYWILEFFDSEWRLLLALQLQHFVLRRQ